MVVMATNFRSSMGKKDESIANNETHPKDEIKADFQAFMACNCTSSLFNADRSPGSLFIFVLIEFNLCTKYNCIGMEARRIVSVYILKCCNSNLGILKIKFIIQAMRKIPAPTRYPLRYFLLSLSNFSI